MRLLGFTAIVVCSAVLLPLGCSSDSDPPDPGDGAAGSPAVPQNEDELALLACEVPEPCGEAGIQLVENVAVNLREDETRCVLNALAQRTPGRYRYETTSSHGQGHDTARHVLLVAADGSVQYARTEDVSVALPGSSTVRPDVGQRCTLKASSYFEDCAATLGGEHQSFEQPFWGCVFGDGTASEPSHLFWFESCVEQTPSSCEAGG